MSVQFGKVNFDGKPVDPKELDQVRPVLAPYGPDGEGCICKDNVGVLYRAFHTTKESKFETQPYVSPSGMVITWDGRLDNREDLILQLEGRLQTECTDLAIVATAYQCWGAEAFSKMLGDWAISIWNPTERSFILAKDPIGTHPLYYLVQKDHVTWSTILDPFLLFADRAFGVCEEYIAGWFSSFPATHLSPFDGIQSVPPSSFVLLRSGKQTTKKYWDFNPSKRILHTTDSEYEEHFRVVFSGAVKRKLRSDHPVLAELSGGIDSSSIVCVADTLIAQGSVSVPRLDTVSYYNDSEPNWNERPYFSAVEAKRGRIGCHIDLGLHEGFVIEPDKFTVMPGPSTRRAEIDKQFNDYVSTTGTTVVLSGVGGDEVMGGVPTPFPELSDLLVSGRLVQLACQLKAWALVKRKPWFHLLIRSLHGFMPVGLTVISEGQQAPAWLRRAFVTRNWKVLHGYQSRLRFVGPSPSFQENLNVIGALRRNLACDLPAVRPCYEKRYPYLDRELLEFILALPRNQLVRPGRRRSLMRRALVGIVPELILDRKRKGFVVRSVVASIASQFPVLLQIARDMISSTHGIVDAESFRHVLQDAHDGKAFPLVPVMRTLDIETWLRGLAKSERTGAIAFDRFQLSFGRRSPTQEEETQGFNRNKVECC